MISITLLPEDLRDLVRRVLPFVGTDEILPMLTGVAFEARGGMLTATATDRYVIGVAKLTMPEAPDVVFSITAGHWREVLRLYPVPRKAGEPLPVTLTVDDDHLTTSRPGAVPEVTARFPLLDPDWLVNKARSVVARHLTLDAAPEQPSTYNPRYLARFAHLGESITVLPSEPNKPTVIISHDFVGAIMPMHRSTSLGGATPDEVRTKARAEWADALPAAQADLAI